MKAQKNTKIMVTCALLVALQVILARFLSINTTFVVVNFSFLAVALSGILFGPLWALAVGAVSDLIGATLFPFGAFFPGFTVTAGLVGLIYGLFLHQKGEGFHGRALWLRVVGASLCASLTRLVLNSVWLYIMYGKGLFGMLPARFTETICMVAAQILLIPVLLKLSGASASHALAQYGLLSGMVLPILLFPAAFPAAVGTLLLPEIARESARGRAERVRALTRKTLAAALYMAVGFCALFLAFGQELMELLYDNAAAGGLLTLLTPLLPLLYVESICDSLLKGLGRQGATLVIETVDSALRILGILLLLPRLGMMGYVVILYGSAVLCALTRLKLLLHFAGMDRRELLLLLFEPVTMARGLLAQRRARGAKKPPAGRALPARGQGSPVESGERMRLTS